MSKGKSKGKFVVKSADLDYYSFNKVLSRNAVYNFILGARGLGKTYGAKLKVIKNAIHRGEQFVYLRRYKTELANRQTFFDDVAHEFPEFGFRVNGGVAEMTRNPLDEKPKYETIGYFIALSQGQSRKSVAFPKVTWIIFDEFIIEKGATHYLPEEHIVFNNFYATVDRWKDKTRVMFLANSVSIMNPYFIAYDIEPNKEFLSKKDGFISVHFADSAMFTKQVLSTRFGTFIAGTDYAEYAVNSVFADNHEFLLARKSSNANYLATIETGTGDFSVWIDVESHPMVYYVQTGRPKSEVVWTMDPATMAEGKRFVLYTDRQLQAMRAAFSRGHVKFDGPKARNSFIPIFKR